MRVILVDDEIMCLEELEYLLMKRNDIEIIGTFSNPLDVIPAMSVSMPDAVFLDIGMPYMNGIELAEKIHKLNSKVKVVFVTAYSKLLTQAFPPGVFECLLKPVNAIKMNSILEQLIAR